MTGRQVQKASSHMVMVGVRDCGGTGAGTAPLDEGMDWPGMLTVALLCY